MAKRRHLLVDYDNLEKCQTFCCFSAKPSIITVGIVMIAHKAYKFRLYPNREQRVLLAKTFGCCRFVYNHFLTERTKYYETNKNNPAAVKKGLNYYDTSRALTALKKNEETSWLKEAPSQAVQCSVKSLDNAFGKFFKKLAKYPKFKRLSNNQSCSFPQGFHLNSNSITLPKLGQVKIILHRDVPANVKFCYATVSKTCSGEYYVSLTVEEDIKPLPATHRKVGVDLGLIDVVTLSNGFKSGNPKKRRRLTKKLVFRQRQHSRKIKESSRRKKARVQIARVHSKITRQTNDFNHKLSRSIVDKNQVICVEDLNVNGMMKNRRLARSIGEVAWGEIIRQLEYKSLWGGRSFVKVGRFFASSKICNHCGTKRNLKLSERFWACDCGAIHDRDNNAAVNILNEGLRVLEKNKISSDSAKAERDKSVDGLTSDSKEKFGEASRRVTRLDYVKAGKSKRVCEPRCHQIHLVE